MTMYNCFDEIKSNHKEGSDFQIRLVEIERSEVAIIAPHGGKTESGTSEIAYELAKDCFNFYSFEGAMKKENYKYFHLTSHKFDEPRCLDLISNCSTVISIHGCKGHKPEIYLGGLDISLRDKIETVLFDGGYSVSSTGHSFPAAHSSNIVNRGMTQKGVQLELTAAFRQNTDHKRFCGLIKECVLCHI